MSPPQLALVDIPSNNAAWHAEFLAIMYPDLADAVHRSTVIGDPEFRLSAAVALASVKGVKSRHIRQFLIRSARAHGSVSIAELAPVLQQSASSVGLKKTIDQLVKASDAKKADQLGIEARLDKTAELREMQPRDAAAIVYARLGLPDGIARIVENWHYASNKSGEADFSAEFHKWNAMARGGQIGELEDHLSYWATRPYREGFQIEEELSIECLSFLRKTGFAARYMDRIIDAVASRVEANALGAFYAEGIQTITEYGIAAEHESLISQGLIARASGNRTSTEAAVSASINALLAADLIAKYETLVVDCVTDNDFSKPNVTAPAILALGASGLAGNHVNAIAAHLRDIDGRAEDVPAAIRALNAAGVLNEHLGDLRAEERMPSENALFELERAGALPELLPALRARAAETSGSDELVRRAEAGELTSRKWRNPSLIHGDDVVNQFVANDLSIYRKPLAEYFIEVASPSVEPMVREAALVP